MKRTLTSWLLAIILAGMLPELVAADPGVWLSDGSVISGEVRLVPGAELRFHDGSNFRTLAVNQVAEIRLQPTSERLVRAFTMPEAGKAIRVESGEPYPLRELAVIIGLTSGETLRGHLYATAVLVALADEDQKVFLPAKQQGAPGMSLAALVYPVRVVFTADANATQPDPTQLRFPSSIPIDAVGLVTRDTLASLQAVQKDGLWRSDAWLGAIPYVAVQTGLAISVGWEGDTPELHQRLDKALPDIRDFFDDKHIIAVRAIPGTSQIDSLVRLARRGPSTDGPRKPWHVEIWRWIADDSDPEHVLFCARGTLLRGLYGSEAELPQVTGESRWWAQHRDGGLITLGSIP